MKGNVVRAFTRIGRSLTNNQTAVLLLVAQASIALGALLVNIFSARAMGPEMRGELALYLQIAYAGNTLLLLGRQTAYLRFPMVHRSLPDSYRESATLSRLPLGLSVLASVVVGLAFEQWSIASLVLTLTFFAKLSSGVFVNMQKSASIAAGSVRPYLFATLVSQFALVVGSIIFMVLAIGHPAPWLLLYGMTSALPYVITELIIVRRFRSRNDPRDLTPIKRFGLKLVPAAFLEAVLSRSDRFLIPLLSTFAQLGVYSVVSAVTSLITWPAQQYTASKVPSWRAAADQGTLRIVPLLTRLVTFVSGFAALVGLAIYAFLVPIFGAEYEEGRALVLPLAIAAVLQTASILGNSVNLAIGRARHVTMIAGAGLIGAIPALILLVPQFGATGAAWAVVIGQALGMIVAIISLMSGNKLMKKVRSQTADD